MIASKYELQILKFVPKVITLVLIIYIDYMSLIHLKIQL